MSRDSKDKLLLPYQEVVRKEFDQYSVEYFTQGKTPLSNEDAVFVNEHTLCVMDGATPKIGLDFGGKTGGEYASFLIGEFLQKTDPTLNGTSLVNELTRYFEASFAKLGITSIVENTPEARPTSAFACARLVGDRLLITQVGDVNFRINGTQVFENYKEIDIVNAQKRVKAIEAAKSNIPDMPIEELLRIGREAITGDLNVQVKSYQNNPTHPLGYGAIDSRRVPEKFIKIYNFEVKDVDTLEIFSDGYFKVADETVIASWEEAFREVEAEDPYKIAKYPSTKGSSKTSFTDDRTTLIARFKKPDV